MRVIQPSSKRIGRFLEVPNLIELQKNSYRWFLEEGLPELFQTFSPIYDFTGQNFLEFVSFYLSEPKHTITECRERDLTYEAPIRAVIRIGVKGGEVTETELYLGDLPLMTDLGTFVINGKERVVVSQLSRSPGVYFEEGVDTNMQFVVSARIIPMEGTWLDLESDANLVVRTQVKQQKKFTITELIKVFHAFERGRAQMPVPVRASHKRRILEPIADPDTGEVLVEAKTVLSKDIMESLPESVMDLMVKSEMPLRSNEEMYFTFGEEITLEEIDPEAIEGMRLDQDVEDVKGKAVAKRFDVIDAPLAKKLASMELKKLKVLKVLSVIEATLKEDPTTSSDQALLDFYKKLKPGETATPEAARSLVYNQFFEIKNYDLGKVGRRFMNQKLGLYVDINTRNLTSEDLANTIIKMVPYLEKDADRDDIDDLKNKRVRSVGELLQAHLRTGFVRMEKVAKEKMTSSEEENMKQGILTAVKPINGAIKGFFNGNQLSVFMDQTNPLSELVNKRRLSSMGPGGLQKNNAKLEVRDVHRSHYGRICPIETPEGQNIGLISQLTIHARVDEFGFIQTPYRRVKDGYVTDEIVYLTAQEESGMLVAPADTKTDENGLIVEELLQVRAAGGDIGGESYPTRPRTSVNLMDVSPVQIVSAATALIPFLENDDANRALMGANMQRQAVPLVRSERPYVGTGYERVIAVDSGAAIVAHRSGLVENVTSLEIQVRADEDGGLDIYPLQHMMQSNKSTSFTQRPVIELGQRVLKGDPLADGACVDDGGVALGRNILVAFMPWGGYNYEDAILLSERLVKDDVYTSIHIDNHETEAVDTKLGQDEITRDIPNIAEEALRNLDENGIVRIGAEVRTGDILVGKVTPKGQVEQSAEERLIIAIFGKKAEETRDVSLKLPHGEKGTVVGVNVYSRFKYLSPSINKVYMESKKRDRLECDSTGEPLQQLPPDDLQTGKNMRVQVHIAQKRKLMVGDKMAGRHGNKGVISKILPVEDMPFLMDGTPVDIVLNPLGVPSRMNIGQILETHLGYAGKHLGVRYHCPAFEGATETEVLAEMDRLARKFRQEALLAYANSELALGLELEPEDEVDAMFGKLEDRLKTLGEQGLERIARIVAAPPVKQTGDLVNQSADNFSTEPDQFDEKPFKAPKEVYAQIIERIKDNVFNRAGLNPQTCKSTIRDGLTGDQLPNPITVGIIYMLKLEHLVDEKIHARSTGPYSLVTQQPLGGKAMFGGQRFGEMEVWALEAYGAAHTLQELLTIKSDDVNGRMKAYESIVRGEPISDPGIPESFKILVNELRSLGLKVIVSVPGSGEKALDDLEQLTPPEDNRMRRAFSFSNN